MRHGLATAEIVFFRSVVAAGDTTSLADVRGVTPGYPLRGVVQVADSLAGVPENAAGIPARGEVWVEPSLLARLGAAVGDELEVGRLRLRVAHTLEFRPDEGWRLMEIAPTALLNYDDVLASGLLAPGSIVEYVGLYAGDTPAVEAFREDLAPLLRPQDEIEDFRDGRPEVGAAVANAERFLVLAALVSVLLGGVAVAMAARRFVARRLDAVALMKCLGARHREVLRLNLVQLLLLVVAAGIIGCAIGFVAQFGLTALLADFIEAQLPPASLQGAVLGPITALGRRSRLRAAATAAARRSAAGARAAQGRRPAAAALYDYLRSRRGRGDGAALRAVRRLRAHRLPARRRRRNVLRAVLCRAAARARLQRFRGGVGVAWRYGIANVARRGRESSVQVVAFGIGLMVLLLLDVRAHRADDGMAGDAAGGRPESLSH